MSESGPRLDQDPGLLGRKYNRRAKVAAVVSAFGLPTFAGGLLARGAEAKASSGSVPEMVSGHEANLTPETLLPRLQNEFSGLASQMKKMHGKDSRVGFYRGDIPGLSGDATKKPVEIYYISIPTHKTVTLYGKKYETYATLSVRFGNGLTSDPAPTEIRISTSDIRPLSKIPGFLSTKGGHVSVIDLENNFTNHGEVAAVSYTTEEMGTFPLNANTGYELSLSDGAQLTKNNSGLVPTSISDLNTFFESIARNIKNFMN